MKNARIFSFIALAGIWTFTNSAQAATPDFFSSLTSCPGLFAPATTPEERIAQFYAKLLEEYRLQLNHDAKYATLLETAAREEKYFDWPPSLIEPAVFRSYLKQLAALESLGSLPSGEKIDRDLLRTRLGEHILQELKTLGYTIQTLETDRKATKATRHFLRRLQGPSPYAVNFPHSIIQVQISADSKYAVTVARGGAMMVWDLEKGLPLPSPRGQPPKFRSVEISQDGKRALSATKNHMLLLWDLMSGQILHPLQGHSDTIQSVRVNRDFTRAISAAHDSKLILWNLRDGSAIQTFKDHGTWVTHLEVDAEFKWAISSGMDGKLILWDLERQLRTSYFDQENNLSEFTATTKKMTAARFSADSKKLALTFEDGTLSIWNLETGRREQSLAGHAGLPEAIELSPDFKRAVTYATDPTPIVWDLVTGTHIKLHGHTGTVTSLAVTPDFKYAYTAATDKSIAYWDLRTGELLTRITPTPQKVTSLQITPDGKHLISGDNQGEILDWDLGL